MTKYDLHVKDLSVSIDGKKLLKDISFDLPTGDSIGFIGGSGSGKTLTALAVSGLLPRHAEVSGSIKVGNREILGLEEKRLAALRGDLIGMVFQEPKTALNPLRKLGRQMTEALTLHYSLNTGQRREAALRLAESVGLREPERIINAYPHEVSGGQRQRAAIAAAISASPQILFADEPTTALDVTVQQGIIQLFKDLTTRDQSSLVFISHDLAVLAQLAEKIYVFHEGEIIEAATTKEIVSNPRESITKELLLAAEPTSALKLMPVSGISEGDVS